LLEGQLVFEKDFEIQFTPPPFVFRPKQFLTPVQIKNDKKCVPNSVGIFLLSKLSHPGPIFNSAYSSGTQARKSHQNLSKTFFSRTDCKTIRNTSLIMWICFGWKTESDGPDFQLFPPRWYRGLKSQQNSTELFFNRTDGLQNYGFFFSKKIEIFEIQNFNKIPSFTISFLFF